MDDSHGHGDILAPLPPFLAHCFIGLLRLRSGKTVRSTFIPEMILFDSDDPAVVASWPVFRRGSGDCYSAKLVEGIPPIDLYGFSGSDVALRRRLRKAPAWLVSSIRPEIGKDLEACGGCYLAPDRKESLMAEIVRRLRSSVPPGGDLDLSTIWDEEHYQRRLEADRKRKIIADMRRRAAEEAAVRRRQRKAERQRSEELYKARRLLLESNGVTCLHHLTHMDNLKSIQQHGLLSRSLLEEDDFVDIANHRILRRRGHLDHYVPLYLASDTPMFRLVRNRRKYSYRGELVLLEVELAVLRNPEVLICAQNAASRNPSDDWELETSYIDWEIVLGPYRKMVDLGEGAVAFGTDIPWDFWKKARMAEVLVPERVPWRYVRDYYPYY